MMGQSLLHPKIWQAIAGATFEIPTVNSRVYYFPLRHFANATSLPRKLPPSTRPLLLLRLMAGIPILCTISSVQLLADPITDEVFAKLTLIPFTDSTAFPNPPSTSTSTSAAAAGGGGGDEDDKIVSFSKILTSYDVKKGGGFSVPKACADFIFPELNLPPPAQVPEEMERPAQVIKAIDVHGKTWRFRHIYSNDASKQHILTTGWSNFVDSKKLVEGNTIVFIKKFMTGKMRIFIGTRRTGPSKNLKGNFSPETVAKEADLAAQSKPFEVVYYPRVWLPDFVVNEEDVHRIIGVHWRSGMKVKMAVETTGLSRIIWVPGTVSKLENHLWPMLEIKWDESLLKKSSWVSPWQVILVAPANHAASPPVCRTEDINK